jgi:hypothetical protein
MPSYCLLQRERSPDFLYQTCKQLPTWFPIQPQGQQSDHLLSPENCFQLAMHGLILAAFMIFLFTLPGGIEPIGPKPGPELEAKAEALRAKEICSLHEIALSVKPEDTFAYLREKLFRAIDYAIRRHDWYEEQRARVFQQVMTSALWILTASVTIVGIGIRADAGTVGKRFASLELLLGLSVLVIIALVSLLRAVVLYNSELDANRPYRLISDIRFWFFRYNMPAHLAAASTKDDIHAQGEAVISERERFFSRIKANLNLEPSLREDFEQLFILQVLQRYKSDSLRYLRYLLSYLSVFFGIEVCAIFVSLIYSAR